VSLFDQREKRVVSLQHVAVIIATRNEAEHLEDCIQSLLKAAKSSAQVLFIDDQSTDQSLNILNRYVPKIKVIHGYGKGPSHARNLALQYTDRSWIAFTDGDCRVDENWLDVLCEGINQCPQNVFSIGGMQKISPKAQKMERLVGEFLECVGFVSDYLHHKSEIHAVKHNPTCNVLYSRQALEAVNGFDETLWPCEDLDLDLRLQKLGYHALFQPKAIVEHRRPKTFLLFLKMMKRYGFGHAHLVKKHGHCQKLHWLPILFAFVGIGWLLFQVQFASTVMFPLTEVVLLLFFLALALFFCVKSRSLTKAIVFPFFWTASVFSWLVGYYQGSLTKTKVASPHE